MQHIGREYSVSSENTCNHGRYCIALLHCTTSECGVKMHAKVSIDYYMFAFC